MTRDEAVGVIQTILGFRTDLVSNIITMLQVSQTMLEQAPPKPWFLTSERSYIVLQPNLNKVALPTNFLVEVDDAHLYYNPSLATSPQVKLVKESLDQLREIYSSLAKGAPEAYAILGNYFYIFPTPNVEYTIELLYIKSDALLTTNIENKWLKYNPYVLIGKAGGLIANSVGNQAAAATFKAMENEGRTLLVSQNTEREFSNRELQIGGTQ
jgi:hypothetical protein